MLIELNERLQDLQEQQRYRDRLQKKIQDIQENLKEQKRRLRTLRKVLQDEKYDVDQLEYMTLAKFYHILIGDKEERLDKEKQEYLAAKMKYDECSDSITILEQELQEHQQQLQEYSTLDQEYQDVLNQKEEALKQSDPLHSEKLFQLSEALAEKQEIIRELEEAITAGMDVRIGLSEVQRSLSSAHSWGTYDLLGGGAISTMIKHNKLDDARTKANRVQNLLLRFKRELQDVNITFDLDQELKLDDFTRFADLFFDNLFTDWSVQKRIKNAQHSTRSLSTRISQVITQLQTELDDEQYEAWQLWQKRLELLEQA